MLTHGEILSNSKPRSKAICGLLGAGICSRANLKEAVMSTGVTAKESIGQGGLPSSGGPKYHNPWVGEFRHNRSLAENYG